ncbi:cellulose binding domain-containing protein [Pseudoduganella namucuonensis]|uniref:Cellulose binding domain-containing protein n=1 Tax=Pseudoduganella namucuonensis TaxID=1035707 RepID=A0A1I7K860_9BURK|nr:cellulose binding domain-containing protein [Pseudoduganella namucuonensis]SFU93580.1 Cellulose binding domain-containing protein [Pseudoduganella namucuonensis]
MTLKPMCALLAAALLMSTAQAETYKWDAVAMGGGGFVSGVIPSKSERGVVYARTDVGGAYRWDQNRARWVALTDWLPEGRDGLMGVESLAVDPNNAANVYLMTGTSYFNNGKSAILRSSDYGQTFDLVDITSQFKVHGNGMGRQNGEKLQVDPGASNVLYAGTRRDGLFKSADSGATWSRVASLPVTSTPNDNGISLVLLDPTSVDGGPAQRIFVGVSRLDSVGPNLYFSYDGGETFEPVEGGPTGLMPQRAVMSPEGKLYITYANGAGPHPTTLEAMNAGQVWEYDAAGGNWTNITPAGMSGPFGGISIDPADPLHLVASTTNVWYPQGGNYGDRIFTSRDAGRTWVDVIGRGFAIDPKGANWINGESIHWAGSVEFDPFDSKSAWVVSGNGLFRTTNIDAPTTTWGFDVAGIEESVPFAAISVPNGPLVSVIGDFDGFTQASPAQYGARHNLHMGTTTGLAASADGSVLARVGNAIQYSTNSGASWTKAAVINGNFGKVALSADGQILLHTPSGSTTTYRSANFGASWTTVTGLSVRDAQPVADAVNPLRFYAYDNANGRMLVSNDGGVSFSAQGALTAGGSKLIAATPGVEGDVWACLSGGGLAHTTDSGATFGKIGNVTACGAVGLGKAAPGANYPTLYMWGTVGGVRGMLRSIDKGVTWVRINDDAHQYGGPGNSQFVTGDMNTYGTVYMSSVGRGMVYGSTAGNDGDVTVSTVNSSVVTAPAQPANKCEYVITASWQGGHIADIRITNNRSTTVNGWSVSWTYSENSTISGWWNGGISGTSPTFTATATESWNTNIAPGATVSVGMVVGNYNAATVPAVTGAACN